MAEIATQERAQAELIRDFVARRTWALVGFSTNPAKYGNIIYHNLRGAGYTLYPVNPRGGEYQGAVVFRSLAELPERPEVVNVVVPPRVSSQIVRECAALGITRVWMQPGAESLEAIQFCQQNGIEVVYNACAMVHKHRWES